MTAARFFLVFLMAMVVGLAAVGLFGAAIPLLISAASWELFGLGVLLLVTFIAFAATAVYGITIQILAVLRSKS